MEYGQQRFTDERSRPGWKLGDAPLKKLAVLRALQIGDLLCAIPALRALRKALPDVEITLLGLPWSRCLIQRYPEYLNSFLEFPGFPGLPERAFTAQGVAAFLAQAQRAKFDVVVQMHGSGAFVNPLTALLGARMSAGFCAEGEWRPAGDAERFMPYPANVHEVHRHLKLVEFLGIPPDGEELEFPLYERDYADLAATGAVPELSGGDYVCIHPGARYLSRRWGAERFAEAAKGLARDGLQVVITGTAEEAALAEVLSRSLAFPHLNLAGKTSLGAMAALLRGAQLLVSNDTGASHLAAAVQTRSVVVVTGSDAARWAPLNRARHRTVSHRVECQPCEYVICPIGHPCAAGVSPAAVLHAARGLLETPARERSTALKSPPARGAMPTRNAAPLKSL
ncbi:MAG TPA: glycosyltransferase family 9 protein [Pirellulales bacterium]|nr:glycosyltransferase family 9 protein [Pirellulales bacterium]